MSTAAPPRSPNLRGPQWKRLSQQILRRDGAFRNPDGQWHGLCLNYQKALEQGILDALPRQCRASNGLAEVWACHGFGWSTHPALRMVSNGIIALCKYCDPDRNPEMRPYWWGNPEAPVTAGWERRGEHRKLRPRRLGLIGRLASYLLALPLWVGLLVANAELRHYPGLRPHLIGGQAWPPTTGLGFLGHLLLLPLALFVACYALAGVALRYRLASRSLRALWHGIRALAVLVGRGLRAAYRWGLST
jgi:hypothetical protein